jgi:hypothetical protein
VEGNRQFVAQKISGWLARVFMRDNAMNNHDAIAEDVFCPIDSDDIAEKPAGVYSVRRWAMKSRI